LILQDGIPKERFYYAYIGNSLETPNGHNIAYTRYKSFLLVFKAVLSNLWNEEEYITRIEIKKCHMELICRMINGGTAEYKYSVKEGFYSAEEMEKMGHVLFVY
jgi:hypothetical protein